MTPNPGRSSEWRLFRRAFLWGLAAFTLAWSLRAGADDAVGPTLTPPPAPLPVEGPGIAVRSVPAAPVELALPPAGLETAPAPLPPTETVPYSGTLPTPQATVTTFGEDGWSVTIVPRGSREVLVNGLRYEDVYASIPYRRAEYLANPGYRHEATLEVMFGQLRPKTVVSQYQPRTVPLPPFAPYKPYRYSQTELNYLFFRPMGMPYPWNFPLTSFYPSYPAYPMLY